MWWAVQQITALLMMKREPEPPPPPGFWKQRLTFAPFLKERAYDPNFKRAWIQNAPWRKVLSPGKRQDLSTFLLQLLRRKCADSSSPSSLSGWYNFNKTPTNTKEFGSPTFMETWPNWPQPDQPYPLLQLVWATTWICPFWIWQSLLEVPSYPLITFLLKYFFKLPV